MTKLADIQKKRVIPLKDVSGIYLRDLPMNKLQEVFIELSDKSQEDFLDGLLLAFDKILCDKNGENFEDITSKEDIGEILGVDLARGIFAAIPNTIMPDEANLGNSNKAG